MSVLLGFLVLLIPSAFVSGDQWMTNDHNLTVYMHQIEQKVSVLESQTKTTEQDHAAVLANVLSQMSSQRFELLTVKSQLNSTLKQLEMVTDDHAIVLSNVRSQMSSQKDELLAVKAELNSTLNQLEMVTNELKEVQRSVNSSTKCDLDTELVLRRNDSEVCFLRSDLQGNTTAFEKLDVGFEASANKPSLGTLLKLTHVSYNAGGGFDPITGLFTAPVSGTYLIWLNLFLSSSPYTDNTVNVNVDMKPIARVLKLNTPRFTIEEHTTSRSPSFAQGTFLVSVRKGSKISFSSTSYVHVTSPSSYGGTLLSYHLD